MANIVDVLRRYIRPYYYYIITIVILIIFLFISYYAYTSLYANKKSNKFTNVANANRRSKDVNIYLFHVDWCPHCKKALPEWNSFKNVYDNIIDEEFFNIKDDIKDRLKCYLEVSLLGYYNRI